DVPIFRCTNHSRVNRSVHLRIGPIRKRYDCWAMMRRARISSCLTILAVLGIGNRANAIDADVRNAVVEYSDAVSPPVVTHLTKTVSDDEIAEAPVPSTMFDRQISSDRFHTNLLAPRWTQYFWFFVVLLLAVLSQSLMVAGFLAQRAKRRRAEAALSLRDSALRRSSERIGQL